MNIRLSKSYQISSFCSNILPAISTSKLLSLCIISLVYYNLIVASKFVLRNNFDSSFKHSQSVAFSFKIVPKLLLKITAASAFMSPGTD
jgi:hypothetical protein